MGQDKESNRKLHSVFYRCILFTIIFIAFHTHSAVLTPSKNPITLGETVSIKVGLSAGQGYCNLSSQPSGLSGKIGHGNSTNFKPNSSGTFVLSGACTAYTPVGPRTETATLNLIVNPKPVDEKPIVSITAPTVNESVYVGSDYSVKASASDDKGIAYVDFYIDGQKKSRDSSYPYQYTWPLEKTGTRSIYAKAYDTKGQFTQSQTINVNSKYPPLTISSSESSDDNGSYRISWSSVASATEYSLIETHSSGLYRVIPLGLNREALVNPAQGNGTYTYQVSFKVCKQGMCYPGLTSNTINVTVNLKKPVQISSINKAKLTYGKYKFSWSAVSLLPNYGYYEYRVRKNSNAFSGWVQVGSQTSVELANLTSGQYVLEGRSCNSTSCSVAKSTSFQVYSKPSISIHAPSSAYIGATVALTSDASVSDGGYIQKVEYFANGVIIGLGVGQGYTLNWLPDSVGSKAVFARAWNNDGDFSDSANTSVLVENKPVPVWITGKTNVVLANVGMRREASSRDIWVDWTKPSNDIEHYLFRYAQVSNDPDWPNNSGGDPVDVAYQMTREQQNIDQKWVSVENVGTNSLHMTQLNRGIYYVQVRGCDSNNECGEWSTSGRIKVDYETIDLSGANNAHAIQPLVNEWIPGGASYKVDVNVNGDIDINIPFEIGAGVNKMQPDLSINYSSSRNRELGGIWSGNTEGAADFIGFGWRVSGLSAIHKCTVGVEENLMKLMKKYSTGKLCLDGQPLQYLAENTYYLLSNRNIRIEYIPGVGGSDFQSWFRVAMPDGNVREYGNGEASVERTSLYPVAIWNITKITDTHGNNIIFNYMSDVGGQTGGAGGKYVSSHSFPKSIVYGDNQDSMIKFYYAQRENLEDISMDELRRNSAGMLMAHRIEFLTKDPAHANSSEPDYRIAKKLHLWHAEQENIPLEFHAYKQLEYIQECGYLVDGEEACYKPFHFRWEVNADSEELEYYVGSITDSLGRQTEFSLAEISENIENAQFSEQPFGTASLPSDTAVSDKEHFVVTQVRKSDGLGNWRVIDYAYQGLPLVGRNSEDYVGFFAQRRVDRSTGVVTYLQQRVDFPFAKKLSREVRYDGIYTGGDTNILSRTEIEYQDNAIQFPGEPVEIGIHGGYYDRLVHNVSQKVRTEYKYEDGELFSVKQERYSPVYEDGLLASSTNTTLFGSEVVHISNDLTWGEVESPEITSAIRTTVNNRVYLNRVGLTGTWLPGFLTTDSYRFYDSAQLLASSYTHKFEPENGDVTSNNVGKSVNYFGDEDLELTKTYSYTSSGLLSSTLTQGAHIEDATSAIIAYDYNRYPSILSNGMGQVSEVEYDMATGLPLKSWDLNNNLSSSTYDALGNLRTLTDSAAVTKTITREFCNQACPLHAIYYIEENSPITPTSRKYYDALKRMIQKRHRGFDGRWVVEDTNYNRAGRIDSESLPYFLGENPKLKRLSYDNPTGRISEIRYPDGGSVTYDYFLDSGTPGLTTSEVKVIVDEVSSIERVVEKTSTIDVTGRVTQRVDAVGTVDESTLNFSYDEVGNIASIEVDGEYTVYMDHDDAGNRIELDDPNTGLIRFKYNALNLLRERTLNSGQVETFKYDKLGRLENKTTGDGAQSWHYDTADSGVGLLDWTEFSGTQNVFGEEISVFHRKQFSYDSQSRLEIVDTAISVDGDERQYSSRHRYDDYGRLDKTTSPSGLDLVINYNDYGYDKALSSSDGYLRTINKRDAFNNIENESFSNGIVNERVFAQESGRLIEVATRENSQYIQNSKLVWLSDGSLASQESLIGATREEFEYDNLNRLTDTVTYATESLSQQRHVKMSYSSTGNIISKVILQGNGISITGYDYSETSGNNGGPNAVKQFYRGGDACTVNYNDDGIAVRYACASGDNRFIDTSARGKITGVKRGVSSVSYGAKEIYLHGIDNQTIFRRSVRAVNGTDKVETTFYVDGFEDVYSNSAANQEYARVERTQLPGAVHEILTTRLGMSTSHHKYFVRDHLNSVISVLQDDGDSITSTYDSFGIRKTNGSDDVVEDRHGFSLSTGYTGHEHMGGVGLVQMGGRVYDPELGRFLSPDIYVQAPYFTQSYNRYSYVFNNPMSNWDPTGYVAVSVIDGRIDNTEESTETDDDISEEDNQNGEVEEEVFVTGEVNGGNSRNEGGVHQSGIGVEPEQQSSCPVDECMTVYAQARRGQSICKGSCHGYDGTPGRPMTQQEEALLNSGAALIITLPVSGALALVTTTGKIIHLSVQGQRLARIMLATGEARVVQSAVAVRALTTEIAITTFSATAPVVNSPAFQQNFIDFMNAFFDPGPPPSSPAGGAGWVANETVSWFTSE